jgi:predicted transcriptional regulator
LLGISFNSTRYNVDKLLRNGEVVSHKEKRYVRLYPAGTKDDELRVYSFLRSKTLKSILRALINEHEGLTQRQLCESTGLAKSTISENLKQLMELGLIEFASSDDLKFVLVPSLRPRLQQLIDASQRTLIDHATGRFIDLWDF